MFSLSFLKEEIETWTRTGDTEKEGWGQDSHLAVLCIALGGPGPSALDMWYGCVYGHGCTCPRGTNRVWSALRVMPSCLVNHASGGHRPHVDWDAVVPVTLIIHDSRMWPCDTLCVCLVTPMGDLVGPRGHCRLGGAGTVHSQDQECVLGPGP